ncbi:MAG: hypothetical protein ABIR84_04640, partial [Candidatus Nitrotoga sp.]
MPGFICFEKNKKGLFPLRNKPFLDVARPERFERPTPWLVGSNSYRNLFINQLFTSVRHILKQSKTLQDTFIA